MRAAGFLFTAFSLLAQPPAAPPAAAPAGAGPARTDLNLLGRADAEAGEARRNENVQFNLIDNNALKDLNVRLGTTATLIQEFRADRSYFSAEFGNRPPAPIHLPASKASPLHGSAFVSHVNSVFNARSFFTAGGLPPAHENHYGVAAARDLWRGASFSADASQQFIRGKVNGNVLVPRASERTPMVTDPAGRRLIERFLAAFPAELPNRTDINERALNTNSPQSIDDHAASARVDQRVSAKDVFGLRYSFMSQQVDAFQLVAGQNPDTTTRHHAGQITWTRTASAATLLQGSLLFDRVTSLLAPEPNAVGPQVNFSNVFTTLGPSSSIPIDRVQNRFRYAGAVRQQRGAHNWYAGADLSRRQLNGTEVSSHRGNLYFRNDFGRSVIDNFLLGTPSRFSGGAGNVHRGFRQWDAAAYAGDVARLYSGLTVSYGLRYELVSAPLEVNGLNTAPYGCDCNNFSPRFGFAWRLPGNAGLLRAAYGLHYGEIFPATYHQLRFNPPHVVKFEIQAPDLLAPFSQLNVPVDPFARAAVYALSPQLEVPYSHQYNVAWEPFAGANWRVQLAYVGSRSHDLLLAWYTNRARLVPGIPQTTATVNDRRPDQRFYDVRRVINGSHAYFDAARIALVLPRAKGLSIDASYWFSKAIDLGSAYTGTGSSDDTRVTLSQTEGDIWTDMKGPSPFDHKHAFLVRASWTTPRFRNGRRRLVSWVGEWEMSGVVLLKSGTPFTVITGSDGPGYGNVDGDNGDRPHLVDPSILGRSVDHPDTSRAALPASAFAFLRPNELRGNLGANTFRKDGIANVNAAISRTVALHGDRRLVMRAESVNLLNTPQFAEPWRELASPSFGFITNTLNEGRSFRFLLRFSF
jgi:hypothetical protein